MATLIDSYSESNYDGYENIGPSGRVSCGQSFTGADGVLDSCKFYLAKATTPTGNLVAKIYSHSGVFGTSGIGDTLLATSDVLDASTVSAFPTFTLYTFNFSGANRITLSAGTYYVVQCDATSLTADGNTIRVGEDGSSSTHAGNEAEYNSSTGWHANSWDVCFYVYTATVGSASLSPSASVSPSLSPSTSISPSLSPSTSLSPSASISPSYSPSASTSPSSSISPSLSPSTSRSPSTSQSPSLSPSTSTSPSISPSTSVSPSVSPSYSPSASTSPSSSRSPSASTSPSASVSPSEAISETTSFIIYF